MLPSQIKIPVMIVVLLSLAAAVVSQSQTVTSMVQPSVASARVQDLQTREDLLQELVAQMDNRLLADAHDYEALLLKGVLNFHLGETELALHELERLVSRAPEFHLAHLVRADLLAARVTPLSDIGSPGFLDASDAQLLALRDEIQTRLRAHINQPDRRKVPLQFLQLNADMHTALLVDKSRNRLYLFERRAADEPPLLVRDFYVSTGRKTGNKSVEGDLRTPEGVYFITSWIPDDKLPEKYGVGAFPMDYPNSLDRQQGKTGDGIWLHGTDRIYYSRPPLDSEGCVVMSNIDLQGIRHLIKPGITPIVIAEEVQWVEEQVWYATRARILSALEQWRHDWESLDVERYLSHYAENFWSPEHDYAGWSAHKRRIAQHKTRQEIELDDVSLFYSPVPAVQAQDTVVVRFRQNYRSNNFNSVANKRLYLARNEDAWKIVYEGY